jgi:WXG100 family type VII secretion target
MSKIQIQWSQMQTIQGKFQTDEATAQKVLTDLTRGYEDLKNTWEGEAANKFFQEMENDILPRTRKMIQAFTNAAEVTKALVSLFQQTEQDAANIFKSNNA